mmetsp:Transcript_80999/g.146204  ORF Transcript_80999/g.146204 Transcript_80999/m.146204 type:complete len:331 (-) Transcript_80999:89-1081(-)
MSLGEWDRGGLPEHGVALGVHLRRAGRGAVASPRAPHRAALQPEAQPRADGGDHVRDLRRAQPQHLHPGGAGSAGPGPDHGPGVGQRRGRHAHHPHLRRLRPAALHQPPGPGRPRAQHPAGQALGAGGHVPHHHRGAAFRETDEGAAVLRGLGPHFGVCGGEGLPAARQPGDGEPHERALAVSGGALQSRLGWAGVHGRGWAGLGVHLQLLHRHAAHAAVERGAQRRLHHVPRLRGAPGQGAAGLRARRLAGGHPRAAVQGPQERRVDRRPGLRQPALHAGGPLDEHRGLRRVRRISDPRQDRRQVLLGSGWTKKTGGRQGERERERERS